MSFSIIRDDLLNVNADAICVAASEDLHIDGGVGLSVAKAAGLEQVQAACAKLGSCKPGEAVVTDAFALDAKVIIHMVAPVYDGDDAACFHTLRSAYLAALSAAKKAGCSSIAMPLVGTGAYQVPAALGLDAAVEAIRAFLVADDMDVTLALYDRRAAAAGVAYLGELASFIDDEYVDLNQPSYGGDFSRPLPVAPMAPMASAQVCSSAPAPRPSRRKLRDVIADALPNLGSSQDEQTAFDATICDKAMPAPQATGMDLNSWLEQVDEPLSQVILDLIDERGLTDAEVYNRANISRQVFNKIKNQPSYHPGKSTVLALCVALELDLAQTSEVLSRAGYAFNPSAKFDLAIKYFIINGIYDQFEINKALFALDLPLLGAN